MDTSSVNYSDLPDGFQVAPVASAPSYSDLPQGFSTVAQVNSAPKEGNSFNANLQEELNATGNRSAQALENPNYGPVSRSLNAVDTGFSVLGDYPKAAVETAYKELPQNVRNNLSSVASGIGEVGTFLSSQKPAPYGTAKASLPDRTGDLDKAMAKFDYENPIYPEARKVTGDIMSVVPAVEGSSALVNSGINITKDIPSAVKSASVGDFLRGISSAPGEITPPIPDKYFTSDTQQALSQAHALAGQHINDLYDWRDQMAAGKTAIIPDLKTTIDSAIEDAKSQVANPSAENSAVKKLQGISDNIANDGTVPLTSLTELDRYFNSLPKSAFKSSPINIVARNATKSAINKAAETYPEFGEAHTVANDFFTNYKNEFDNSAISNIWNPEDTKNLSMYANGKARLVNPETQQRAEDFMANVKSGGVTAYNQIKSLLPDAASQDAFENEFKKYIVKTDGNGRWNAIKTLISDPFNNTGRKVFDVVKPQYNPDTKAFLSGKTPVNYGDQAAPFSSYMDDSAYNLDNMKQRQLDAQYDAQNVGGNESSSSTVPKPLALPQYRPSVVDNGSIRPMTDNEWVNHNQQQQIAQETSNTLSTRQAQEARKANELTERNQRAKELNTASQGRGASELGRATIAAGNPPLKNYEDSIYPFRDTSKDGFKRGGAVQPTEAQKSAGNYFKPKVNFQGLPISIENPKGSVRSGKDKNGKEWSVKMPFPYGYIRGTTAKDMEHIDCFIGPNFKSIRVYVIDQKKGNGSYDECKVMLGFPTREAAIDGYRSSYSDKKNRIMKVTKMLMPEFKEWLKKGDTKKPLDMVV